MIDKMQGGCLCGAVRYEITAEPEAMGKCHCIDCQKATGSAYFPFVVVKEDALKVTGNFAEHESTGSSGKKVWRHFCKTCGSSVFNNGEYFAGTKAVHAGTLDNPKQFKPVVDIWVSQAVSWDILSPETAKVDGNPER